jgi:hypothetical protein
MLPPELLELCYVMAFINQSEEQPADAGGYEGKAVGKQLGAPISGWCSVILPWIRISRLARLRIHNHHVESRVGVARA